MLSAVGFPGGEKAPKAYRSSLIDFLSNGNAGVTFLRNAKESMGSNYPPTS
jgi:hypothetical protein